MTSRSVTERSAEAPIKPLISSESRGGLGGAESPTGHRGRRGGLRVAIG